MSESVGSGVINQIPHPRTRFAPISPENPEQFKDGLLFLENKEKEKISVLYSYTRTIGSCRERHRCGVMNLFKHSRLITRFSLSLLFLLLSPPGALQVPSVS